MNKDFSEKVQKYDKQLREKYNYETYPCKNCSEKFDKYCKLNKHEKRCRNENSNRVKVKKGNEFPCNICE